MNRANLGVAIGTLAIAVAITIAVSANSNDRESNTTATTNPPKSAAHPSVETATATSFSTDTGHAGQNSGSTAPATGAHNAHADHGSDSTIATNGTPATHDHDHDDSGSATTNPGSDVTTTTHSHGGDPDEIDPTLQLILDAQIAYIRDNVIEQYATASLSGSGGWVRAGRFSPGAGAHYVNISSGMHYGGDLNLDTPMALIYDGIGAQSEIVGVMYYSWQATPPDAFVGTNDVWHKHTSVCFKLNPDGSIDIPFPVDRDNISREDCEGAGGSFLDTTAWMLHVWAAPGHESSAGVFSHLNPNLNCYDGTWNTDDFGFCDGTEVG